MSGNSPVKSIMLVDDSFTARSYHRIILSQEGYHLVDAADGLEALMKARQRRYYLFLIDINMPRMDGISCSPGMFAEPMG